MLRARNVIAAVFLIASLSIAWTVIDLARPPDSAGRGADSYGTRHYGFRAMYDLLRELGFATERSFVPPINRLNGNFTFAYVQPDARLASLEPRHLQETGEWIRRGGRVFVALGDHATERGDFWMFESAERVSVLEALGLGFVAADLFQGPDEEADAAPPAEPSSPGTASIRRNTAARRILAEGDGEWRGLTGIVRTLQVPHHDLATIRPPGQRDEHQPVATFSFLDDDGKPHILAAKYRLGEGEIVVLSDSRLLRNHLLFQEDNAVLAAHLFADLGGPVVFDGFYHGLTVRGNPAWLLTQHPYGLLAVLLLLACGVWIARVSARLGPSMPPPRVARRAVSDYVDAMAGLFDRARTFEFALRETRDGVLWTLAKELRLSHRHRHEGDIVRALERRDAPRAERLRTALVETEVLLSGTVPLRGRARKSAVVQAARKLTACL